VAVSEWGQIALKCFGMLEAMTSISSIDMALDWGSRDGTAFSLPFEGEAEYVVEENWVNLVCALYPI
jgi:hypothetical protein